VFSNAEKIAKVGVNRLYIFYGTLLLVSNRNLRIRSQFGWDVVCFLFVCLKFVIFM